MRDGSKKTVTRAGEPLGTGGQGSVFYAIDGDGKEYAVKVFKFAQDYDRELVLL
jgi:hypothetical protein